MKEKVIVIVGPTAVGKTSLSISLAQQLNGEIISGDSMQIYKGLDIGTAKATQKERSQVPHYLIDEIEPTEAYTVSDFKEKASARIEEIASRDKLPIIAGGTGLYIESLLYNVSHGGSAAPNPVYRAEMERYAAKHGNESLWKKLADIDPEAAEKIHFNNVRRVIRALEVFKTTGKRFSALQLEKQQKEKLYDVFIIGLTTDRALLYQRIDSRVDEMLELGLLKEAEKLIRSVPADAQSIKGIGYKEWIPYFEDEESLEKATEKVKQNSRRYAKRQLTWFRNRMEVSGWWNLVEYPETKSELLEQIEVFLRT